MNLLNLFSEKRESVHIDHDIKLIIPGETPRAVFCYKCDRELGESHDEARCQRKGATRRVFFGRLAVTAASAAVVAKIAPEVIIERGIAKPQAKIALPNAPYLTQEFVPVVYDEPVPLPLDAEVGPRSGTFHARHYGFEIEYKALSRMNQDRVKITGSGSPLVLEPAPPYWAEQVSPPLRRWNGRKFEGSLHETITMVNREFPEFAVGLRAAIMSCNPEWRRQTGYKEVKAQSA